VFAKYALSVSSASFGAVTTPGRGREDTQADGIAVPDFAAATGAKGR